MINGDEIIYRDYMDISVAVATPSGLLVPVIRNCESLSFADIEKVKLLILIFPYNYIEIDRIK